MEDADIIFGLVSALFILLSWLAALAAADRAKKAEERLARAEELAAELHRDEQLSRLELSFNPADDVLILANKSTTAAWENVTCDILNSDGPIVAFGVDPPKRIGPPHRHIDLGPVDPGQVRPIDVIRVNTFAEPYTVVRLTCWHDDRSWPVLKQVSLPPLEHR